MIASPRILVIGDVMTDIIVRPEGPLARGSDRRASIAFLPGGSAANQAAWLASFGVENRFRRPRRRRRRAKRDGAAQGRWASRRGSPATPSGRPGGSSRSSTQAANAASSPIAAPTTRFEAGDIPDALIAGAAMIHLSGYSFFAPGPRAAVLDVMRRAGDKPISVDPASAEFLREAGPEDFLGWTRGAAILFPNDDEAAVLAGSDDPETQCARLAALYPLVVVKRGAAGCEAAAGAMRWRAAAPKVEAIDTTGAGDAFVAAFLAARLAGARHSGRARARRRRRRGRFDDRRGKAETRQPSSRLIETIASSDRLAAAAPYSYLRLQQGFRSLNLSRFVILK